MKYLDFTILDVLSIILSFFVTFLFFFHNVYAPSIRVWLSFVVLAVLIDIFVVMLTNPFSGILRRYGSEELIKSLLLAIYNFIGCCVAIYLLEIGADYSRQTIVVMYFVYFVVSLIFRLIRKKCIRSGVNNQSGRTKRTLFIVCMHDRLSEVLSRIDSAFLNEYDIKGVCVLDGEICQSTSAEMDRISEEDLMGEKSEYAFNIISPNSIVQYVLNSDVDEVFFDSGLDDLEKDIYFSLVDNGKIIHMNIESIVGEKTDDQYISCVGTYKALSIGRYSPSSRILSYQAVKRVIDIIMALIAFIFLIPIYFVVKVSYLLSGDTTPVIFTQTRVGVDGKKFRLIKFRSMAKNADEMLSDMLKNPIYKKEWDENQKFQNDPRVTKVGSFLRKTSLDEMPQFINVLKGEMSVVGPRPLVENELESHGGLQIYNKVKPGITGWWACNGRSNTTYEERLELEYYYVKNCSFYLDALCIIKTIVAIIKRDGAK